MNNNKQLVDAFYLLFISFFFSFFWLKEVGPATTVHIRGDQRTEQPPLDAVQVAARQLRQVAQVLVAHLLVVDQALAPVSGIQRCRHFLGPRAVLRGILLLQKASLSFFLLCCSFHFISSFFQIKLRGQQKEHESVD